MSDFLYIDQSNRVNVEKTSQANISKGLYNNYQIRNSCVFNSANTQYLSRTFSQAGSQTTATLSMWFKRGRISRSNYGDMLWHSYNTGAGPAPGNYHIIFLAGTGTPNTDSLVFNFRNGGSYYSNQVLRDSSAWYHLVVNYDSSNIIQSERFRFYVNGVRGTFISDPAFSLNYAWESAFNLAIPHIIGWYFAGFDYNIDGYVAETHFIDGQALDPNNFGYFDNQKDFVWKPKKYSGTYGTNGFYLPFNDTSNIGRDFSGNGNNWTTNGSMVGTGTSSNIVSDSPTNNYPVFNVLETSSGISQGNLVYTGTGTSRSCNFLPTSGRWYLEARVNSIGGSTERMSVLVGNYTEYINTGQRRISGATANYGSAFTTGDTIGIALNIDSNIVTFYRNNISQGDLQLISDLDRTIYIRFYGFNSSDIWSINFGQRGFSSTPPTGFRSLCSANLPVPSIKKPNQYMDIVTFNATGSNQLITGLNFRPDFVWIKNRASWAGPRHTLYDSVRGAINRIDTSTTEAEAADNDLFSFQSNGFEGNLSGTTYVSWAWKGGSRLWNLDGVLERTNTISIASPAVVTLTNHNFSPGQAVQFYTTGSLPTGISPGITYYVGNVSGANTFNLYDTEANAILGGSTGRIDTSGSQSGTHRCRAGALLNANRESGFSIVRYIGTGANASFGHSLGVAPNMVIIKNLETAGTNWFVYHSSIQGSGLYLNSSGASFAQGNFYPGNPWSVGVNVGTDSSVNELAKRHIAYCFAEKEGYSKFGSYTGNGSADGTFVYCGFRPSWIMTKGTVSGVTAYNWIIHDVRRNTFNVANLKLAPNSTQEENGSNFGGSTMNTMDILSNGFKLRTSNVDTNGAGNYIFAAFAETPFKYALAR